MGGPSGYKSYNRAPHPNSHHVRPYAERHLLPDVHARACADQDRIRAEKLRWLEIEREKYRLPKRGRLIDDMPA